PIFKLSGYIININLMERIIMKASTIVAISLVSLSSMTISFGSFAEIRNQGALNDIQAKTNSMSNQHDREKMNPSSNVRSVHSRTIHREHQKEQNIRNRNINKN
ncbi:hypothetical protein N9Q05_02815, partial [bacterium]|nr:hypothetical protein [bacterium]